MKPVNVIEDYSPFPGLRPFALEDAESFFGRDHEADEIILKLSRTRYITLIGARETGKSSLVFAGVLPKLIKLNSWGSGKWKIVSICPGKDPFGNLESALQSSFHLRSGNKTEIGTFTKISEALTRFDSATDLNLVLVIDQLEELIRYQAADTAKFVEFIKRSIVDTSVNLFTIITLTSDFLGEFSKYPGLSGLINNSNYIVSWPADESWKDILYKPLNVKGINIESGLAEEIISDVKNMPENMPLYQHAMMRAIETWHAKGDDQLPFTRSDYQSTGTIRSSVKFHIDEIFGKLSDKGRKICEILFRTIARKGPSDKNLRHPVEAAAIMNVAGCSEDELFDVIKRFRQHGFLLPTMSSPLTGESIIDIKNEWILQNWDKLKEWIADEYNAMQIYIRLADSSALFQQGKTGLLKSPDLKTAISWRESFKPSVSWAAQYDNAFERAMVYLRTSEKASIEEDEIKKSLEKKKSRRIRFIAGLIGAAILIAAGLTIVSIIGKLSSDRHASFAEQLTGEVLKQKVASDSLAQSAIFQKNVSDSVATLASQLAIKAREDRIVAEEQRSFSDRKVNAALLKENQALGERDNANRLRMLSISKILSLKSMQMNGSSDLQALLAYQAYLFNKKFNGSGNDADVYAGLYNVAIQHGSIFCKSFKGHNGAVRCIAFSPVKREFYTSGDDGRVEKWSLDKQNQALQVIYSGSEIIDVLAVSPDESWLACGSSNSSIRMIPLKGNDLSYEMKGHKGGIKSLIFSYDGKYLYSAAVDGKVLKWDIAARTSINVANGSMEITSLDISSNGKYLAGISTDGSVIVWNPGNNSSNFTISTEGRNIKVVRFNPETSMLALGDADGNVDLWDVALGKKISTVRAHDSQINEIRFNPTLKQMATAGNDKKIKIYDISDPADLSEAPIILGDNEGIVLTMQFSPDGQLIISGESGGEYNLRSRPAHMDLLISDICNYVTRNMTEEEWNTYVAKDIPYEKTCQDSRHNIKVEPVSTIK